MEGFSSVSFRREESTSSSSLAGSCDSGRFAVLCSDDLSAGTRDAAWDSFGSVC